MTEARGVTSEQDVGTWVVLMQRYARQQLPRARRLLERVQRGECLDEEAIAYLRAVCIDSRETLALLGRNPSYKWLFTRPVGLYVEIIELAVANERRNGSAPESRG